ncbi:MAG: hypothetical protein HOV81_09860 [Kofleriaceae bacterium]|nr:hypothetical protein [Kofleriaceae bacterium]
MFAPVRSSGCFVYFEGQLPDIPACQLLDTLVAGLDIADVASISTRNRFLSWSKLRQKKVDAALDDSTTLSISLLVGTPQDVRLGGAITLRLDGKFPELESPALAWVGAESQRWPATVFVRVARDWLRIAAEHGKVLSGGVLAAADLRDVVVETTQVFHTYAGEEPDTSPRSFRGKMQREKPASEARERIRRVYPITLLGPKFASQINASKLAAAGARNLEHINGSIIFDATPDLREAWSREYLAETVELRRLLWPLTFQNPADDPDRKGRR